MHTCLLNLVIYSVSQKKSPPPEVLSQFFQNGWEFFDQILHAYYAFLSTLDYEFLSISCNFDKVMPYYAWPPGSHHVRKMSTIGRNARWHFLTFLPNSNEFLVRSLHAYWTFISTLEYKFLFNYLQLWRSYAILSATTQRAFQSMDILSTLWWLRLIWHNFIKVIGNWIKMCSPA